MKDHIQSITIKNVKGNAFADAEMPSGTPG
jgi:hypothetical protein